MDKQRTITGAILSEVLLSDPEGAHVVIRLYYSDGTSELVREFAYDDNAYEDFVRRYLGGRLTDGSPRVKKVAPLMKVDGEWQLRPYPVWENGRRVRHEVPTY